MERETDNIRLLKAAFQKDWDYLAQHGAFKYQLSKDDGSRKSYEDLIQVGNLLLRQREEIQPRIPPN